MKLKSWGVRWYPGMAHTIDFECRCGEFNIIDVYATIDQLAGFDTGVPPSSADTQSQKIGGLIYRCPHCQELFWRHVDENVVAAIADMCPDWPRTTT